LATRSIRVLFTLTALSFLLRFTLLAQNQGDVAPLTQWPAPLFWQPNNTEDQASRGKPDGFADAAGVNLATAADITPLAQTPANSLVFVGMTPCRVVDTRPNSGLTGAFGQPGLVGGGSRTFPIPSSSTCSIPASAGAYSFNVTVVPPGFLDYITMWPTGQAKPFVSTVNSYLGTVAANAAIMPAGTNGSIDVYASQNTDLIIDINGYYTPQTGITLDKGTPSAPSLSFAGDPYTGVFSAGPNTLNVAAAGESRLSITGTEVAAAGVLTGAVLNAKIGFNLGGNRILSGDTANVFVGIGAGLSNNTGNNNAFLGTNAGIANNGSYNTFLGSLSGQSNSTGQFNAFVGYDTGNYNTTHSFNTFVGSFAGALNGQNDFNNLAIGNSFVGSSAGNNNTLGYFNSFFGRYGGTANTTGVYNTVMGAYAELGVGNLMNATAIGARSIVSQNDSLVLGAIAGLNDATSETFVGIGTPTPQLKLHVKGTESRLRLETTQSNRFSTTEYLTNARVWHTGVGGSAVTNGSAGKYYIYDGTSNQFRIVVDTNGNVGINTTNPDMALSVNGNADKPGGGSWAVFSDERLKNITGRFTRGLDAILKLQPIRYEYKPENDLNLPSEGEHVGFSAQEIEKFIPEAVVKNEKGYLLINNDPILWTMLNAIKEQHAQIVQQTEQNRKLQERLNALEQLLSSRTSTIDIPLQ
jgi:hypothetical protein